MDLLSERFEELQVDGEGAAHAPASVSTPNGDGTEGEDTKGEEKRDVPEFITDVFDDSGLNSLGSAFRGWWALLGTKAFEELESTQIYDAFNDIKNMHLSGNDKHAKVRALQLCCELYENMAVTNSLKTRK